MCSKRGHRLERAEVKSKRSLSERPCVGDELNSQAESSMLVWCRSSAYLLVECVVCMCLSFTLQCDCSAGCVCAHVWVHAAYDCSPQLFSKTQWCRNSNYFWPWMANILLIACHFPRKGFYLPQRDAREAFIIWSRWKCQGDFTVKSSTVLCKIQVTNPDELFNIIIMDWKELWLMLCCLVI